MAVVLTNGSPTNHTMMKGSLVIIQKPKVQR